MTIPTREEALRALDKLSSDYDLAGGWSPDPMPLLATLRSYIEGHTGEPVAFQWRQTTSTVSRPLYASPVQPVLEWVGKTLNFNGLGIGRIWMESRGLWNTQLGSRGDTEIAFGYASREQAESVLDQRARQWLSGGDK